MPAATVALLAVMFALQLALPRRIDLPQPGVILPLRLDPVVVAPIHADPAINSRGLFAADRRGASLATQGAEVVGPLDGAVAVGVAIRRGAATAFVQSPTGTVTSLRPGQSYHGWRLARISTAGLTFRRGDEATTLPLTASPPAGQPGMGR